MPSVISSTVVSLSFNGDRDGLDHETNDCTVTALSHAFEISYKDAHRFLKKEGRKDRHGCQIMAILGQYEELFGIKYYQYNRPGRTITSFLEDYPKGVFLVRVRKHIFTVRDGKIYDNGFNKSNTRVINFISLHKPIQTQTDKELKFKASKFVTKLDAVLYLYEKNYNPHEIANIMISAGMTTTEGSVKCFIRTINKNSLREINNQ